MERWTVLFLFLSCFCLVFVCFGGGNRCSDKVNSCENDAEEGYDADYVPESLSSIDVHYDADMIKATDSLIIGRSSLVTVRSSPAR